MPTNRKRRAHQSVALGASEVAHLCEADSATHCRLCAKPWSETWLDHALAGPVWDAHREELLAGWPHPFPCLGAALFDGVPFPNGPGRGASREARRIFRQIQEELARGNPLLGGPLTMPTTPKGKSNE